MKTSEFDYPLPEEAIAQTPVEPRDAARLLVAENLEDHRFRELPSLLKPGDLVVVNDTRVRAARLHGTKARTGGRVEALLLDHRADGHWTALVKPARRIHPGDSIHFGEIEATVTSEPDAGRVTLVLDAPIDIEEAIEEHGETPLPPYITTELTDPDRYQTVYAARTGSAAAPTAGLHVTRGVLDGLAAAGVGLARIELRVGLGTFRPIATDAIEDHAMHQEWFSIPPATSEAIRSTRERGGDVVAIGTTVVRALESRTAAGGVEPGESETDLFITPGFEFAVVDRLVTNFHLPRSSLIVMVAAFMGPSWREAYDVALRRGYRFLSFGDAMLADRLSKQLPHPTHHP